jgi:hypothetical protein
MNDLALALNLVLSLSDVPLGLIQMLGKHLFFCPCRSVVRFRGIANMRKADMIVAPRRLRVSCKFREP